MISIIVPVYNASLYLRECLDSILTQSYTDYELILVDDGSTDGSEAILSAYRDAYPCIKLIRQENKGVSAARNRGLDCAVGEWVAFIDADDYLLPGALALLVDRAYTTKADVVIANAMKNEDGVSTVLHTWPDEVVPCTLLSIKHLALWGYLFRTEIIRQSGIRFIEGLAYSEDRLFIYQLFPYCRTIAYCREPIYIYRINPTSACASANAIRKASHHFVAAGYLGALAQTYADRDMPTCRFIEKECRSLISQGIYAWAENPGRQALYKEMKASYISVFGKNAKSMKRFYAILFRNLVRYEKKRILTAKRK